MHDIALDQLDLAELKQLEKDVAKAIKTFEARHKKSAKAAAEAAAREFGFSLSELTSGSAEKPKAASKFRHPENPEVTWSGRGRKPKWFVEALERGMSEGDLLA